MTGKDCLHVTLLATTRGRRELIARLFESLKKQTCRNFTLLLGDQNPEAYLSSVISEYEKAFPIERIFLAPQSLSEARNVLLSHVRGQVVALTDDDCYYAPDCLEHVVNFFGSRTDAAALIGNANGAVSALVPDQEESRFSIFRNAPSWVLFFRASAMRKVGLFDVDMGIGSPGLYQSGEETDYLVRLLDAGVGPILRAPAVRVYHDEYSPNDSALYSKAYGYARGRMYLLRKHGFPLWFKLVNVVYPLLRIPCERCHAWSYRKAMFWGRLVGFFKS